MMMMALKVPWCFCCYTKVYKKHALFSAIYPLNEKRPIHTLGYFHFKLRCYDLIQTGN